MPTPIKKLIDNGKVAVLYSPGFGAGWSTWNRGVPEIVFDPAIVKFVEHDQMAELNTYVTLKYPDSTQVVCNAWRWHGYLWARSFESKNTTVPKVLK